MNWIQMGPLGILSCPQGRIDETNQEQTGNFSEHLAIKSESTLQTLVFTIG